MTGDLINREAAVDGFGGGECLCLMSGLCF